MAFNNKFNNLIINVYVNPKTLNIATLNVCGLKKRSQYPDFVEYFDKYDLICFVETKLEDIDVISIPGFQCFSQPRKQKYIRKSGGIALFAKDEIFQHCKYLATDSDYVMWISIDKSRISIDENLIIWYHLRTSVTVAIFQ